MSDSPLLSKMDALLKKHRGGDTLPGNAPGPGAAPPNAWLPVLTDVIERGTPPAVPAASAASVAPPPAPAVAPPPATDVPDAVVSDTLAAQLMSELTPRLSEVDRKSVV